MTIYIQDKIVSHITFDMFNNIASVLDNILHHIWNTNNM